MKHYSRFFLILGFLACVGLPPLVMLGRSTPLHLEENRTAAQPPQWPKHLGEIKTFCNQAENYINDHFGFRSYLVKMSRAFILSVLNTSTSSSVMIGKDGWLFFRGDKSIESYRNSEAYDANKIENWEKFFKEFKQKAYHFNLQLVVLIPPASTTIYPKYLPDFVTKVGNTSALDRIHQILKKLEIPFADPTALLIEKSKDQPVFFKTDTHWNTLGAYWGYISLMNAFQNLGFNISSKSYDDYEIAEGPFTTCEIGSCDLGVMLGWPAHYAQKSVEMKPRFEYHAILKKSEGAFQNSILEYESKTGAPSKLLAYRDSFFTHLIPFVSEQFSESVYIWRRDIQWKLVMKYKPNIVVFETAERFLAFDPPQHLE